MRGRVGRGGLLDEHRIGSAIEPKLPGQRGGGNGSLVEDHSLRADGRVGAAGTVGRQRSKLIDINVTCDEVPLGVGGSMNEDIPILPRLKLRGIEHKTIGTGVGRGVRITVNVGR